jgi:hypothetical protein
MKSEYVTSSCHEYQSVKSSKRTENSHRAKATFSMPWRVKMKTERVGIVVEAAVGTAAAVHVHPWALRIVVRAPAIFGHLQQMARMIPARDHGARLPPAQLLLWGPMVVFVLVAVASPQIECSFSVNLKIGLGVPLLPQWPYVLS